MPSKGKKTQASASPKKGAPVEKKTSSGKRPRESSEEPLYIVEEILDRKKVNGAYRYKVKWQNYSEDECTWEPAKNLESVKDMLAEFNKALREKGNENEDNDEKEEEQKSSKKKEKTAKAKKDKEEKDEKEESTKSKKSSSKKSLGTPKKKVKTEKDQMKKDDKAGSEEENEAGHFDSGDKPDQILHAKREQDHLVFTIQWKARKDGRVPANTKMTNVELRKHDKDLLLDFYEARLKFVKPSSTEKESAAGKEISAKDKMEEEQEQKEAQENKEQQERRDEKGEKEDEGEKEGGQEEEQEKKEKEDSGEEKKGEENEGDRQEKEDSGEEKKGEHKNEDNNDQQIFGDLSFNTGDDMKDMQFDTSVQDEPQSQQGGEKTGGTSGQKENNELHIESPQEGSAGRGDNEQGGV